ncbi:hypothetical protein HUB98_24685 [Paenibacillus barcinonensis]|uniref:Uncharacterized protein n=1 Tax=Paenibacillus barcinonensis TaxID=198119 RepID=A0A2V4VSV7_PAEBA|nr:hypothetical protein [Paenibacillus barcinonensis]PYE47812.1 hypothetical protein DFQ00_111111 [Paenibacillus barcinonensis]QKS59086.1 hypothetical protein HUB98_24685 [Paenibacillus barcinonensis]
MDVFNNAFLLVLSLAGLIWAIKGMKEKLRLMVFFGVILMLAPVLILMGWVSGLPLVGSVAFAATLFVRKESKKA